MNWYEDSMLNLDEAKELIQQVESMEKEALHDSKALIRVKVKIKNCVENCRSPLDYLAVHLFQTYCKNNYTSKELKRKKIYFPINRTEEEFIVNINKNFKGLDREEDIIEVLKTAQPFKGDVWLDTLNKFVNENKHNQLTAHTIEKEIHVNNFNYGNVRLKNVTFRNIDIPISVNGRAFDFVNTFPPGSVPKDSAAKVNLYFKHNDLSVINTLKEFYRHTFNIIESTNNLLSS